VPSFKRQLGKYQRDEHTDSTLAAYLADGVEALAVRWSRDYIVTTTQPNTYEITPDITLKDKRPIILMASIIYKMGNVSLASFRDADFAYDPVQGKTNPVALDVTELEKIIGTKPTLVTAISAPMRGYSNVFNRESYNYWWWPH
jgi:hypothetical protein